MLLLRIRNPFSNYLYTTPDCSSHQENEKKTKSGPEICSNEFIFCTKRSGVKVLDRYCEIKRSKCMCIKINLCLIVNNAQDVALTFHTAHNFSIGWLSLSLCLLANILFFFNDCSDFQTPPFHDSMGKACMFAVK